jgi:hypothetical protein
MLLQDLLSAILSSFIISPIMTLIDISIIRSHILKTSFMTSTKNTIIDLYKHSIPMGRPLFLMNGVYSLTFGTANTVDYFCKKTNIPSDFPIISCTSAVNIGMMSYKDKEYSNLFGMTRKNLPLCSYGLFSLGAMMTIYGNFGCKKYVTDYLDKYISKDISSLTGSLVVSMGAQTVSTPFHILGMDYYQYPERGWKHRWENIRNLYGSVCAGRMIRTIPAFGIGGFLNDKWKRTEINILNENK